jgi:hypothetical protein
MWESERLGRPRFQVLEILPFAQDGLNAGVPSLTLRKNGAAWMVCRLEYTKSKIYKHPKFHPSQGLTRMPARSEQEREFPLFSGSFLFQNYISGIGKFRQSNQTHGGTSFQGSCNQVS